MAKMRLEVMYVPLVVLLVATASVQPAASKRPLVNRGDASSTGIKHLMEPVPPGKVLLEIYGMSRCPDMQRAEARLDEVLHRLHNITHVQLHFIADQRGPEVTCKHGPLECAGNRQQLCVQDKAPGAQSYKALWKFVQCQNKQPDEIGNLGLAETCLSPLSRSLADDARECMNSYQGEALLRADAEASIKRGATISATIYINGEKRCIHDGGKWYDCPGGPEVEDFVQSICEAYWTDTGDWPKECGNPGGAAAAATATARRVRRTV